MLRYRSAIVPLLFRNRSSIVPLLFRNRSTIVSLLLRNRSAIVPHTTLISNFGSVKVCVGEAFLFYLFTNFFTLYGPSFY